jgi:hypothetical protein
VLLLAPACQRGEAGLDSVDESACVEVTRDPALNGLPLNVVTKQLGQASIDETIILGRDVLSEDRIEILNQYPLPQEEGRPIRELAWTKGYCNTAFWFVDEGNGWNSFDNLTWNDDTVF